MRKKLFLLLVLLTAIFMVSCSRDPEKTYKAQLQQQVDSAASAIEKTYDTLVLSRTKNVGYNLTYNIRNLNILGTEFDNFGLSLSEDVYDNKVKAQADINYAGEKALSVALWSDYRKFYYSLPDYSDTPIGLDLEDSMPDKSLDLPDMSDLPDSATIGSQFLDYGTMLVNTFEYKSCEKNIDFKDSNYDFNSTLFTGECTREALDHTMQQIKSKSKESELYKKFNGWIEKSQSYTENNLPSGDNDGDKTSGNPDDLFQLKLYDGKKHNMAMEFVDAASKNRVVFVTDGTSWNIYYAEDSTVVYELTIHIDISKSDISGYLRLEYKDECSFKLSLSDVKLSGKKIASCNYKLNISMTDSPMQIEADGTYEKSDKTTKLTAKVSNNEPKASGELEIINTERDAQSFEMPATSIDIKNIDEWLTTLDADKLQEDLAKFESLTEDISSVYSSLSQSDIQ